MPSAIVFSLSLGMMYDNLRMIPALWDSFEMRPLCSLFPYRWSFQVMVLLMIRARSRSLLVSLTLCPATSISMTLFLFSSLDFLSSFVPMMRSLVLEPLNTSLLSCTHDVNHWLPVEFFVQGCLDQDA